MFARHSLFDQGKHGYNEMQHSTCLHIRYIDVFLSSHIESTNRIAKKKTELKSGKLNELGQQ